MLDLPELERFFRLHRTLMRFVNQRLQAIPDQPATPEEFSGLPPEKRLKVRDALLQHRDLISTYVAENPDQLPEKDLAIVGSWRHLVAGKFYLFRELKKHTVLLSAEDPPFIYGVLALAQPFTELVGPYWPVLVQTVLLPFQDRIVYDGLLTAYSISFGPGIRRSLNESYMEAKTAGTIVTSLPISERSSALAALPPKARPRPKPPPKKQETGPVLQEILDLIEPFCRKHLNTEYAALCRSLAEKLARKRPSPLLKGQANAWASGIVRTIGWANFLSDPSQKPHMKMTEVDEAFGVSPATGAAKGKAIRDLLKIRDFDHHWTLPSRLDDNPLVWMLSVNGFLMDIRQAPREAQEAAYQKGLIPYIPADRPGRQ